MEVIDDLLTSDRVLAEAKIPPYSIEAEQAVLGGLMLSARAWDEIADRISDHDFYRHDHRLIFRALAALVDEQKPRDVVTVGEWLEVANQLEAAGGVPYLITLSQETPSAANIFAYAEIVRERSVLRKLIETGTDIANSAYFPEGRNSQTLLDRAESKIFGIADEVNRVRQGFANINTVLTAAVERITNIFESGASITGVPTGYEQLDELTSGLQPSDLIIVAGRPSMGKTTFAMNIAEHTAMSQSDAVAIFSMEMPGEQLAMRLLASLGRVELQKLRTGKMSEPDWSRVNSAVSMLVQRQNLFIDDTPALTPTELRARARRLKREHGLSLIMVDYLQLMQVSNGGENRATELSEISRSLKALAKELNVPIIALSQLNRSLEQRNDKRPIMSDLRESGAIEQDADVIVFIYRDEVYDEESADKGTAEVLIRKQRNGPIGSVRLAFIGELTRFENLSPETYSQSAPL